MADVTSPYNALIAANAAPGQSPLATAAQFAQAKSGLAQADSAQLDNAQRHLEFVTQALTPLLAKGPNISAADVASAGADAVATSKGVISPSEIAHFVGQLPSDGPGIQNWLQQHQVRLLDGIKQIGVMRGDNVETAAPGGTQFGTRDARTGTYKPQQTGGYAPNGATVEGPSVMTASGPQKTSILAKQAYDIQTGAAHVVNGRIVYGDPSQAPGGAPAAAAQAQGGPPAAPVPSSRGPGPSPSTAAPSSVPMAPARTDGVVPSPVTAGALLPVGAPSGAANAAGVTAEGSATSGLALSKAADQVPNAQATIANMQQQLQNFTSGPYAAKINRGKAIVNELGQATGLGNAFDPKSIAAQEEYHKQAETLAQQAYGALGGTGSDQQLASAKGSNPNDALSGLGNKQILPMLQGLQDAVQAKNAAYQQFRKTNGDGDYQRFSDEFNRTFSPRAFQFVRMSPDQRQELVKSMNPTEQKQLGAALANAEQRGWIKAGGQ